MLHAIKRLTESQLHCCTRTLGANSTYALIGHHIASHTGASFVRMGDGENLLLHAGVNQGSKIADRFGTDWLIRQACLNIPYDELTKRILRAGNECTYFAPSVSGLHLQEFDLYKWFNARDFYLDNFFINAFPYEQRGFIVKAAAGVTVIHADPNVATGLKTAYELTYLPRYLEHRRWEDTQHVVDSVLSGTEQLVLFSAGPAGKWLAPAISAVSNKVVIDVGNAMSQWCNR